MAALEKGHKRDARISCRERIVDIIANI